MKQLFQDMANGESYVVNAPSPVISKGTLLVATTVTLISAGTERMLVDFGKASYLEKARQQPEKVKMVLEKIKTDGLFSTIDAVRSKLATPLPLGYCNVGVVVEVAPDIKGYKLGDRVVSNGPHADLVKVSPNLCARIPDNVDDEQAVFTVMASIALQGIRLVAPTLGESITVIGVGLLGLITIQLLRANGCRVLAIDFNESKLHLAQKLGAEICNLNLQENPVDAGMIFSKGHGVDAVIITTSTQSNDPVTQAARMSRKRGRIVLVGVTGLELNRADFYEKELTFQVSCSYGPGRHDRLYEEQGMNYPIGFVRWTEQRNFESILDLMADKQLDMQPLISHRYLFENVEEAYNTLISDKTTLGILLQYQEDTNKRFAKKKDLHTLLLFDQKKPIVSFIGAGNYASRVLIPAFKSAGAQLHTIVTNSGTSAVIHGEKAGFVIASTDVTSVLKDPQNNTLIISTRHDSHARLVVDSLAQGKHVFVEKPLAIHLTELAEVEAAYHTARLSGKKNHLMVGFNRRFAPQIQKIKMLLDVVKDPKSFIMTINAGFIPPDHWTQDSLIGGGRIIGEACHFIDLMRFLVGYEITSVQATKMENSGDMVSPEDNAVITCRFADGSMGTIHYLANGTASFSKERIEVFTAGRILQLDNFVKLKGFAWPGFKKMNLWKQDKGQKECCRRFLNAIEQGIETPIPFNEVIEVARVTIEAAQQLRS